MWYRSVLTGKLFDDYVVRTANAIYGADMFELYKENGYVKEVSDPSVIDILKETKSFVAATRRYREIHEETTLKDGYEMVKRIYSDMKRFAKNGGEEKT